MKKNIKIAISSFMCGAIFFGGITHASSIASNIEVYFQPLKYYFDGVERVAPDGQQGFIYNGSTYVPLRFVSETLGKEVGFDGKTYSIYVGDQPKGEITYLEDMNPHAIDTNLPGKFDTFTTNMGQTYMRALYLPQSRFQGTEEIFEASYLLNGQYSRFQAMIAPGQKWNTESPRLVETEFTIYGDGKLLYNSPDINTDAVEPALIDIDLTGVLKLEIKFNGDYDQIGLLEARLTR